MRLRSRIMPEGNDMSFMNKTLSKEIMKRTKLRHKFLKERTYQSKKRYHHNEIVAFYCLKRRRKIITQKARQNYCKTKLFGKQ